MNKYLIDQFNNIMLTIINRLLLTIIILLILLHQVTNYQWLRKCVYDLFYFI